MKKVIITLGLLFCACSGLFSLRCPEREMSRSDEERVEAFMAEFFKFSDSWIKNHGGGQWH